MGLKCVDCHSAGSKAPNDLIKGKEEHQFGKSDDCDGNPEMYYKQKLNGATSPLEITNINSEIPTVNAGYESRIVGTENPTEPVSFDTNNNRWWEDK